MGWLWHRRDGPGCRVGGWVRVVVVVAVQAWGRWPWQTTGCDVGGWGVVAIAVGAGAGRWLWSQSTRSVHQI
jgi:hypothetical protein